MASKALKHQQQQQQRPLYDDGPKFTYNSQETRMRGYVPIYRNGRKNSITDQRTEREHVRSFFGEGNLPYNSFSLVSSPYASEYLTRNNSFRRISPSHQYHKKRAAPAPPPHLMQYNSLPSSGSSGEVDLNARRQRSQKKRQAPAPPEHIRRQQSRSWSLERPPKEPPAEPPVDYDLDDDDESSPSDSQQGTDSGMDGNSRSPSPAASPPPGYSDIAIAKPPTPPPLPPLICEVERPPKPPTPPPMVVPPQPPPLPALQYRNIVQEDEQDGLNPALKAQLLEAARKRMEHGPTVIKKQDPFHERFSRELKKAFEMRQKRLLKGTIKMKFQPRNTIIYKAFQSSESSSPPVTPLEQPVVPKKPANLNGSEVLLDSMNKVEKVAEAEMQQRLNGQSQSPDNSPLGKKVSWTPAQDLNGEVFDDDEKENTVERTSSKADFYEMLYGKSAAVQKQKCKKKKDSSSSQESDYKQGSLRKLKKSVKKSVKNAFGSLRGQQSRHSIDVSIQSDSTWQIYPACMYDEAPEGPINIVRVEKGPAYAYHPERGQLVLLPDYENIIVTDDGRKIREAHVAKGIKTPKKVLKLIEAKLSSVESPGALVVPTPLRDHEPRIIEERHTQDVVEMQFQQVQELNKQFQDEAIAEGGLDSPAWDMIKNPRVRSCRSDRSSWDTVYGSVKMTVDGSLMYCDPANDFKEADENVVHLNASKSGTKYGHDYGDIVPVSKPMIKVLRKGWKAYKDNSESWDLSSGNNPLYASDEEDDRPGLKSPKSEPLFQATDDSGYEGSNSTGNTPLDEVPASLQHFANNSCPNSPGQPKHRKKRSATVPSPLACGYTVSPDGSLSSSQQSVNSGAVAGMKDSPAPSLSTSLDTGLNNDGIRQNTVINIGSHHDHR